MNPAHDDNYRTLRMLMVRLELGPTEVIARLMNEWSDDVLALTDNDVDKVIEGLVDRAVEDALPAAPQNGDGTGVRR